jgi:hypothetical protein
MRRQACALQLPDRVSRLIQVSNDNTFILLIKIDLVFRRIFYRHLRTFQIFTTIVTRAKKGYPIFKSKDSRKAVACMLEMLIVLS